MLQTQNLNQQNYQRIRGALTVKFDELPDEALVPLTMAMDVSGKRSTAIYDGIKKHTFPAPVKLSSRCVRWRVGDLRHWLADPSNYFEVCSMSSVTKGAAK
jgi:predicted DNA-binding transcriptional regulator AlpA